MHIFMHACLFVRPLADFQAGQTFARFHLRSNTYIVSCIPAPIPPRIYVMF